MKNKGEFQNEQVIYECKPHWINLLIPIIFGILCTFGAIIGFIGGVSRIDFEEILADFFVLFIGFLIIAIPFLIIRTNKLVLTDKRIYGRTGILKVKKLSTPISKIQYVNIDKNMLGRIFGYADIKINAITGTYIFKKQSNAEEMQSAIMNTIK